MNSSQSPQSTSSSRGSDEKSVLVQRCRERLVAHIGEWNARGSSTVIDTGEEERTGIRVGTAGVRLKTTQTDLYTWFYTAKAAPLFSVELGDHDVATYQELIREVGQSFFASTTAPTEHQFGQNESGLPPHRPVLSLTHVPSRGFERMTEEEKLAGASHIDECEPYAEISAAAGTTSQENLEDLVEELRRENEFLAQLARDRREDGSYHRALLYRCFEAMGQVESPVKEIQEEYMRTVDMSMFPNDEWEIFR
ncbi:hypothetical protein FALBO_5978 [Fusarium albosuccineum]|uniref:Uncharacterized protein n=1 Tax=Fusarium albosuccineum TaxID=1237068 RepID=A0A8H4LD09_9HYPO|nr:hypothetical protein FALBO_5978 [Fusarium albosuccineum]